MNKLVASLTQATSEVTLAAANLNLDFSIFKFEAPSSYKAFGEKLSLQRKENAEHGSPHTTARKLGALFNEKLPKTPTLIAAYGARVSEILPQIQSGTEDIAIRTIFHHQLGADGTTIWAAATSGDGAVPVHLLACLLARAWTGPQATSIWAQLVADRKKEIAEAYEKGTITHYPTLFAFRQEITRDQLAEWDASARAWVRAADEIKRRELDSLHLIINDLNTSVGSGSDLYNNVTRVWHSSMMTMENLLNGISQSVYSGATLLGISSWHILPNIVSFRPSISETKYGDPLVPASGVLTVGLQIVTRQHDRKGSLVMDNEEVEPGVFWSLSLSHLKFYGPPVQVSSRLGVESTRVSFDQFMLIALGSFSAYSRGQLVDYARFFVTIWTFLEKAATVGAQGSGPPASSEGQTVRESGSTNQDSQQNRTRHLHHGAASTFIRQRKLSWLKLFYLASIALLEAEGLDLDVACMLANCGRRRGRKFWSSDTETLPYMGLCRPRLFIPLLQDTETQIEVLRSLAGRSAYAKKESLAMLIRYPAPRRWEADTEVCFWEVATALPVQTRALKRASDGTEKWIITHRRLIVVETAGLNFVGLNSSAPTSTNSDPNSSTYIDSSLIFCTCTNGCFNLPERPEIDRTAFSLACPCKLRQRQCTRACHLGSVRPCNRKAVGFDDILDTRLKEIAALGETGIVIHEPRLRSAKANNLEAEDFWFTDKMSLAPQKFEVLAGCPQEACLYGRVQGKGHPSSQDSLLLNLKADHMDISYKQMMELIENSRFSVPSLLSYLTSGMTIYLDKGCYPATGSEQVVIFRNPFHESLRALALAADIYRLLPSATVSMSTIVTQSLCKARWVPDSHKTMTRAETFACLAFFETGNLDLSPSTLINVMAMASGDTMFISTSLLCDPSEVPNENEVTRVIGNIGRPGLAMLIAPEIPHTKAALLGHWKFISHAPFHGDNFDGFRDTSVNLSFSGYRASLASSDKHGAQDIDAYLLETILSVYHGGEWIGDLNILKILDDKDTFVRVDQIGDCGHDGKYEDSYRFVAFDSWEELLEGSEDTAVVRAHENWHARLALTCISVQRGSRVFVLPKSVCWKCLHNSLGNISSNNDGTFGPVLIM
ncbi:hypothetical protein HJFPF1_06172 [Paramyrothecium foliicola]|nr:hypothetical protein HJFPF1_06172 [Paramyrothecium foliicola]